MVVCEGVYSESRVTRNLTCCWPKEWCSCATCCNSFKKGAQQSTHKHQLVATGHVCQ
jgi:hypothetical protein